MSSAFDDHWADANLDLNAEFGETVHLVDLSRDIVATVDIPVRPVSIGRIPTELPDPTITARDIDLLGLEKDQAIIARGETWRVVKSLPDGTGWSVVTLEPEPEGFVNDFDD